MARWILVLILALTAALAPAGGTVFAQETYLGVTLEQAVTVALGQNRDVIKAEEELDRADYRIMEATSGALPQINGFWNSEKVLKPMVFVIEFPDSTGTVRKSRLNVGSNYTMNLGASLSQPLYVGGKVGTALEVAHIYKSMTEDSFNAVQQQVVSGVSQAFYSVLLAEETVRIAQESLTQAQNHLDNVRRLFEAGRATEYDILRAQVNVSNLEPSLIEAENGVRIAQLNLKDVMGLDTDTPLTISGTLTEPDTSLFVRATNETAFDNRPDLAVSRQTIDIYEKNIKIVRGDFLPTLTAGTTFQYSGNFDRLRYNAEDWTPYWVASINLSFPIFSGLNNYSRYQQAKVDHIQARTDYQKLQVSTDIEVREAVMNLRKAVKKIESQRVNVQQAQQAVNLAESFFTNGRTTQLEVLDAQLAFEQARTNAVTALYEGKIAEIQLRKSLGLFDIE